MKEHRMKVFFTSDVQLKYHDVGVIAVRYAWDLDRSHGGRHRGVFVRLELTPRG
jgi:hypothetical protein